MYGKNIERVVKKRGCPIFTINDQAQRVILHFKFKRFTIKITKLTPDFEVTDTKKSVTCYEEDFGFKLIMTVPAAQDGIRQSFTGGEGCVYVMMQKDNAGISFRHTDIFKEGVVFATDLPIGASVSFYMDIEGIGEFHQ